MLSPPGMPTRYQITHCPVCGHPGGRELADRDDLRREMEALWAFHLCRLRPGVPTRHLTDRTVFSQEPPLRLAECPGCGTVYRNPEERDEEVVETYAEEALDPGVLRGLFEAQRDAYRAQARRLARLAGPSGEGVEVGSYVGAFLAAAREVGWRFQGVDVNEGTNRFARSLGFRVAGGTLEELDPGRRFDAVAIWNCFEQLPDPRAAARAARRLLAPGGWLTVRVPNGAFYAALRPRLEGPAGGIARALLAHNNLLGFPYRHGLTPGSLTRLLRDAGFRVVRVVGDVLVPTADRWTRRWAAWEERAFKAALRPVARVGPAPWFEVYARAEDP